MSRSTNGRPEPEVIVQYLDGFAYNKVKMEEAFLPGGFLAEKPATKPHPPKDPSVKKEDVDLIANEFELPRAKAEKILQQHAGDVTKALRSLVGLS
ncbi:hypothetical protein BD626DRAFT_559672 [Schizophyllum amplum]|uniref:Nascent polypeptide-associated complex subunit alpha-like UBA domain-containing protein n=1 Tax=Schizophyllum amplum TaxID=97359 RepID=A0A550C351_9AGAR|nr:hypothetical protein BD626DRAFT_559672 [Auriculariopsis ampla]